MSIAGGAHLAPERAREIGASAMQVFTKQPNRWADPIFSTGDAGSFQAGVRVAGIRWACSHDSYLINLASPDPVLATRSFQSFVAELRRASALGLNGVVTHPGNATDGDRARGLEQNARLIDEALSEVPGVQVFVETTAGAGQALGATFEELAGLIDGVSAAQRDRVQICFDTCHVFAAGYDLLGDFAGVIARLEDVLGTARLGVFHLNDSQGGLGSRRDRHADIGQGTLGLEPFRALLNDPRFAEVPKILETPKGDDPVAADRRNLAVLRACCGNPAESQG